MYVPYLLTLPLPIHCIRRGVTIENQEKWLKSKSQSSALQEPGLCISLRLEGLEAYERDSEASSQIMLPCPKLH